MTDAKKCPKCGAEVPTDAPAGICPKCLLAAGLVSDTGVGAAGSDDAPTTPLPSSSRFVPPTPQALARLFPQLEILELIGAGGMGAVYEARQRGLDRLVAVKILPPEVGADPSFEQRFTREAQALARLNHQHIVTVYDFGVTGGLYYFVMEYVDGANLRQLIRSGELQPPEALAIVPQICDALQFAHDEGVVHRDIKPENILVDKRGRVKIADFGLARLLGCAGPEVSLTDTNQVLGTFHYMAPEQLQGSRAIDHRADIYSLGVVFYEMLTGELPLGRFAPPSKKVEVDVRLDEVVLRSLETEPERRYQRASDVKTDVESISDSPQPIPIDPVTGFTEEEAARFAAARKRVRLPATLLAVLGILSLVVLAAAMFPLLRFRDGGPFSSSPTRLVIGMGMFVVTLCGIQLIMIVGAVKMLRLTSYIWAVAASLMALIPNPAAWPFWFLTLPIGIWSLIRLSKSDVKQGFDLRKQQSAQKPTAHRGDKELQMRYQQAGEVKSEVERTSPVGNEVFAAQADDRPTSTGRDYRPEGMRSGTSKLHSVSHVANAMLVLGGLILLSIPLVAGLTIDRVEQSFGTSPDDKRKAVVAVAYITGWYSAAAVPQAFVLIAAALAMRSYRWHRLAIAASILAMLPMSILWPISLPIGLWGLAVLTTPHVRGAFRDNVVDAVG